VSGRYNQAWYLSPSGNSNDGVTPNPGVLLDGSTVVNAAMTTVPVWAKDLDAYSIQFSTTGGSTLVGTLTIQGSNDRGNQEQQGKSDGTLANWTTINFWDAGAGAQAANKAVASGANSFILAERVCTYRWVRLVFAFTSGTGNPRCTMQQKGWP
jgi:hypothetical protein